MDSKIGRLPLSVNRTEPHKFLFDAYLLEKKAKAARYHTLKARENRDCAAETVSQVVSDAQLESVELRLSGLVSTLSLLQRAALDQKLNHLHHLDDDDADKETQTMSRSHKSHNFSSGKAAAQRRSTLTQSLGDKTPPLSASKQYQGINLNSHRNTPAAGAKGVRIKRPPQ